MSNDMRPFSTYPEDRAKLLELAAKAAISDDAAAIELADLVTAILTDSTRNMTTALLDLICQMQVEGYEKWMPRW